MSTTVELPELLSPGSEQVRWKSWPLRQEPRVAVLALLGLVAAGVVVYVELGSPAMMLVLLIALGLAGWRLFLPVDFTVDEAGVLQQWPGRRRYDDWNSFRGFSPLADGFILWPSENCCPLDAAHGLFLPCTGPRAELAGLLRRHLLEMP
jgi:hypothetical protein